MYKYGRSANILGTNEIGTKSISEEYLMRVFASIVSPHHISVMMGDVNIRLRKRRVKWGAAPN
jgi:hypothetical protein